MTPIIKHIHHSENHTIQINSHEGQKTYIEDTVSVQSKPNLFVKQATLLGLWYMFSFFTIVLNKYILTILGGDASLLGRTQMLMSVIFGGVTIFGSPCFVQRSGVIGKKIVFFRNMSILGVLR